MEGQNGSPVQSVKMVITLAPPYTVNVEFPQEPMLCAFMLSEAKKAIDKHFSGENQSRVHLARLDSVNGVKL